MPRPFFVFSFQMDFFNFFFNFRKSEFSGFEKQKIKLFWPQGHEFFKNKVKNILEKSLDFAMKFVCVNLIINSIYLVLLQATEKTPFSKARWSPV